MSFQQTVISRLSDIVNRLNEISKKARSIEELPQQDKEVPVGNIHVSNNGVSEKISLDKIIQTGQTPSLQQVVNASGNAVNVNTYKPLSYTTQDDIELISETNISLNADEGVIINNLSGEGQRPVGVDADGKLIQFLALPGLQGLDSVLTQGDTATGKKIVLNPSQSPFVRVELNNDPDDKIRVISNDNGQGVRIGFNRIRVEATPAIAASISPLALIYNQDGGSLNIKPQHVIDRDYTQRFQNKSGTIALLEDIGSASGNLQSVTTGAGNNVTNNALYVTGISNFSRTRESLYFYKQHTNAAIVAKFGANLSNQYLQINLQGSDTGPAGPILVLRRQTDTLAGVNVGTSTSVSDIRISAADAIKPNELTTLQQVKSLLKKDEELSDKKTDKNSNSQSSNSEIEKRLRKLEQKTAIFELNGGVIPWSGNIDNLPKGWVLCDGSNNTPDLRGRFIVGQDPESEDYDTVGKTGGEEKVSLSIDEMPKHAHEGNTYSTGEHTHSFTNIKWVSRNGVSYANGSNAAYYVDYTKKAGNHFHGFKTNDVGGGQAHENRPPYYVLAYIMFIG